MCVTVCMFVHMYVCIGVCVCVCVCEGRRVLEAQRRGAPGGPLTHAAVLQEEAPHAGREAGVGVGRRVGLHDGVVDQRREVRPHRGQVAAVRQPCSATPTSQAQSFISAVHTRPFEGPGSPGHSQVFRENSVFSCAHIIAHRFSNHQLAF